MTPPSHNRWRRLLFAAVAPGDLVSNLVAGAVAEAGAQQAGDLMQARQLRLSDGQRRPFLIIFASPTPPLPQDLKTGYLLGVSPVAQFYAQLIGSVVSVAATVGSYTLYQAAYGVPSATLQVPTAFVWVNLARLVNGGSLPPHSGQFCIAAALLTLMLAGFCAYAGVHRAADGHGSSSGGGGGSGSGSLQPAVDAGPDRAASLLRWRRTAAAVAQWLPSPVAFAIVRGGEGLWIERIAPPPKSLQGMYVSPNWTVARLIGAAVAAAWEARQARRGSGGGGTDVIMVATGLVLGEGLAALAAAALAAWDVAPLTCAGCVVPNQCGKACQVAL